MNVLKNLWRKANNINIEIFTLYLSYKDKQVPWYARVLVALTLVYAVSPVDFIPDVVPVFGYLDDLVLFPAGAYFSMQLVPKALMSQYRAQAIAVHGHSEMRVKKEFPVVAAAWVLAAAIIFIFAYKFFTPAVLWL